MPRMNGCETIVELRKMGFRGPIIGVCGGGEVTMKEIMTAGADSVLQKPAQSDKLVSMLLTGLQLVVQEATARGSRTKTGNIYIHSNIKRLQTFIEEMAVAV